jgi:acyl-CoA thioester hydrolase
MAGFVVAIPIRFSDIDSFGHVNHARYLTYCEDHRTVMFSKMGADTGSWLLKTGFAIVRLECSYLRPILLDDRNVDVQCTVEALGTSSIRLCYQLETGGQCAALVRTTLVLTCATGSRALTDSERKWMSQFLIQAPDTRAGLPDGDQS